MVLEHKGKKVPQTRLWVAVALTYDIDATVDANRGSKGACHIYNKFNMDGASNMFVAEYTSRLPLPRYSTRMYLWPPSSMATLLIENNKYGIVRYFESEHDGYVMIGPSICATATPHLT